MKTTLNSEELIKLGACEDGLNTFVEEHGDKTVTLSQALKSNGWNDIWWYLSEAWLSLSKRQQDEINLIGCDWAEKTLHNFTSKFPADDRPAKAIEAKRRFIAGEIVEEELSAAWSAAWSAARSARSAGWSAAWSAAESARSAALKEMENDLNNLFIKWEQNK